MALGSLLVSIRATADQFAADMKACQRESKAFENSIKPTKQVLSDMGTVMAGAGLAIIGTFAAMTAATANYGDQLNDARQRTGLTVEELARLGFAAEQSGSSFEGMSTGLKFLSKNMEAASTGGKQQKEAFDSLGISVVDSTGKMRPANDVFLDVADRFANMEDGADKTAISMQVFGKAGADLIPTLNAGRVGLEEMGAAAERAGIVISGDAAKAGDEFNDRLAELQSSVKGVSLSIGTVFLPILTKLFTQASTVAVKIREWANAHPNLIKAIGALGAALAGSGGVLLGLVGVLTILPKLKVAFALMTGPIGLTIVAVAGLLAGIIYFRNEIASGLLKSLSLAVEGFSEFIGYAARLADAVGLDGIAGKLNTLRDSTLQTSNEITAMGESFLEETGLVIANTAAVDAHLAAVNKQTFELDKSGEAFADMAKKAEASRKTIDGIIKANNADLLTHAENAATAASAWVGAVSDIYQKDLDAKVKAFDTIEQIVGKNRTAMGKHAEDVAGDNVKWVDRMSDDYEKGLDKQIKAFDDAQKENKKAMDQAVDDVKDSAGAVFDAMFIKGENVFSTLGNMLKGGLLSLGRSIFEDISGALLGPIKKAFDDFFTGLMEGPLKSLGKAVSGIFTDGAAGAVSTATGIGGSAASGAGSAAGAAGQAAGAGASAAMGIVGIAVEALGSIGIMLMLKRLEGTMNGVEHNTRYTYIELADTMDLILQPIRNFTEFSAGQMAILGQHLIPAVDMSAYQIRLGAFEASATMVSAIERVSVGVNSSNGILIQILEAVIRSGATATMQSGSSTKQLMDSLERTLATNRGGFTDRVNASLAG